MSSFECQLCHKIFSLKSDYKRHLERKFPCSNKTNKDVTKNTQFKCNYCEHIFSRKGSLLRHIEKSCPAKRKSDNDKEQLFQKLLLEHEQMKLEIQTLKKENQQFKKINQTIHTQNNNTQNNIKIKDSDIHFNVLAFGNEDVSFISDEIFKTILNKGFNSVPALVDELHFNKNKPQNHNIYISNIRDDYVLVFDGHDWNLKLRKEVMDDLYYGKATFLELKFKELFDKLDKFTIKKFERFINQKDDDETINTIKKDLIMLMYNRRKMVSSTRKLISA